MQPKIRPLDAVKAAIAKPFKQYEDWQIQNKKDYQKIIEKRRNYQSAREHEENKARGTSSSSVRRVIP